MKKVLCSNIYCGQELTPFRRRYHKQECSLCETERKERERAAAIAKGLGEDDDRKQQEAKLIIVVPKRTVK